MKLTYATVCSGIEAPSVAWHPLGWKPAWFSEIDRFPSAVLKHHHPNIPNLGDMTKIYEHEKFKRSRGSVDVFCGGTPCQSFSVAGLRKGMDDPRGNLALVFLGLVDRLRPRWVVWENVPGVLSSNEGRDFGSFLGALGQLGYGWAYRVLDAQYFGVPQRRRRVFVVAHLGDWRRAAAVLFERHSLQGNPPPSLEAGKGFAANVAPSLTASGRGVERTGESRGQDPVIATTTGDGYWREGFGTLRGKANDSDEHLVSGVAPTLCYGKKSAGSVTQQDAENGALIPLAFGGNNQSGPIDVATARTAHHSSRYDFESDTFVFDPNQITSATNRSVPTPELSHTLPASSTPPIAFSCKDYGNDVGEISPCLRSMNYDGSHQNGGGQVAICADIADTLSVGANQTTGFESEIAANGMAVRRLTPRECERLQGFPDDYTLIPYRGKPVEDCPDGPRYKALGNSMAVPVMRWIGERIELVERVKTRTP